jgi:hypothetical protein
VNLALPRADPATAAKGSTRRPRVRPALVTVALDDGTWAEGEVIAVAKDLASRRWRLLIRWYDPGPPRSMRDDWVMHDPPLIRDLAV